MGSTSRIRRTAERLGEWWFKEIGTVRSSIAWFAPTFDHATAANTGIELIDSLVKWDLAGAVRFGNQAEGGGQVTLILPIPRSASCAVRDQ